MLDEMLKIYMQIGMGIYRNIQVEKEHTMNTEADSH